MAYRDDWDDARNDGRWPAMSSGYGILPVTLLFGAAAVALALLLTPFLESQTERMALASYPPGLDMMATGTVGGRDAAGFGQRDTGEYVVRRSVLQPSPASVCIIRANGMRTGDC